MPENDDLAFGDEHPLNVQYTTKDARLLNQTETGIARAVAEESENFLERQYGRVFIVADTPFTDDAYDVGEVIADTFQREFFGDLNRTVGEAFENALTTLNQTLADLAAEGDSDWVGKLDAVVGVIHENEVFVTQVGQAKAYLVRGHSSTDITEGLSEPGAQTSKTFQNVAEGKLEVGDKVLFTTKELLGHFPIRDLRRTVFLHQPIRAIQKLAEDLEGKRPERFAAVIVELTTVDLISSETLSDEPNEIILSAPRGHFESLQKFQPFTKDTPAAEAYDKAKRRWEREFKPRIKRSAAGAAHRVRSWNASRKGEAPPPSPSEGERQTGPRHAPGTPETAPVRRQPKPESGAAAAGNAVAQIGRQAADAVRPLARKTGEQWRKSGLADSSAWKRVARTAAPLTDRLKTLPWRKQFAGEKRVLYRNLIIAAALVFVISVALSLNATQQRKAEEKVRAQIGQVEELQAKAEQSFIIKDVDGARKQLAQADHKADELAEQGILSDEVAGLQQSLQKSYDRINDVVRVQDPVADLGEETDGLTRLVQSGTSFYALGPKTKVVSFNLNGNKLSSGENPPTSSGVAGTATTSNGDVLLLTDKPSIVQLDTSSGVAAEVDLGTGGVWQKGVALDTVQQNAYVLSPQDDQVWSYTRTLSAFNKAEPYFDKKIELKDAVDIVTGASVHILKSDGSVVRAVGGQRERFDVSKAPAPDSALTGANALAINFANDHIFVSDPRHGRIVEFNADGKYARQFRAEGFGELTDIVVDDKTEMLYALAGDRLWEIKL
ncbi:MAG TPA: hypothetical protein VIF43_01040 [Patescibacteria group bacterium]|jgi:hypothetical protein